MNQNIEDAIEANVYAWKSACKHMDRYKYQKANKYVMDAICPSPEAEADARRAATQIEVKVFHEDVMTTADAAFQLGFRPMIINSSIGNFPLDPLKTGASGREYDLFRNSNLFNTLKEDLFPLQENEIIHSTGVYLFQNVRKPCRVDVLTIAPVRNPRLISVRTDGTNREYYENKNNETQMQEKIRAIFDAALRFGIDCLIIPDFGCSRENNPLFCVTDYFNQNIARGLVKYVFFAIRNDVIKKDVSFVHFHKSINRDPALTPMPIGENVESELSDETLDQVLEQELDDDIPLDDTSIDVDDLDDEFYE